MAGSITREQVLAYRIRAQQLDREPRSSSSGHRSEDARETAADDVSILDIGAQDTGPDGGLWALAIRGVDVSALPARALATAWTVRGAPHLYRRQDLPSVASAVEPFSDADAGKRIFDASRPLKAAGISNLRALDSVAAAMRSVVVEPTVKGEVSRRLAEMMEPAYLRFCGPCAATHLYEMPFRLAALRAGLELQAGTSPPVLQRIPRWPKTLPPAGSRDVIRCYLRLLGPATPKHVAEYLDAPVKDVKAHWPADAEAVDVSGETRWILSADVERLSTEPAATTRLLAPFDLFLQARDRSLLTDEPARHRELWPVLGRPGGVLLGGDLAGTWRARRSGPTLTVSVHGWGKMHPRMRTAVREQAERLAAYRHLRLTTVDFDS